jgi:hypothetical protein
MTALRGERGQASLELLGTMPALVAGALVGLQLLVAAYSLHLVDGAAEAGALAVAAGAAPEPAARAALPGWARSRVEVEADSGRVRVAISPPGPLGAIGDLALSSSAWALPSDD